MAKSCAACAYQKKRCSPQCPLAPFFPPHRREDFEIVAQVFSVSNFKQLIGSVEPHQQVLAAESFITEAKARIADPVRGLTGTVHNLSRQLDNLRSELVSLQKQTELHSRVNSQHHKKLSSDPVDAHTLPAVLAVVPPMLLQQLDSFCDSLIPVPSNKKACGACKHQKKKCPPQCPFAPFFPLNKIYDFENVGKVFGAANFLKLVKSVDEPEQHLVAESMMIEAAARISDLVHGLAGISETLSQQLEDLTSELASVNQQNRFHLLRSIVQKNKSQEKRKNQITSPKGASSSAPVVVPSRLILDLNKSPSPLPYLKIQ
ncbi:hypothetical protein MKW94_014685 [Papaver nudicaule]|uniref:LOB domain-containing protein n=1 Tax=Papaver nudicaule TaxID=74823 RepID=A0AA41SGT3_PAPNU|nr:hypothetical protein [Papaver nudicaule]